MDSDGDGSDACIATALVVVSGAGTEVFTALFTSLTVTGDCLVHVISKHRRYHYSLSCESRSVTVSSPGPGVRVPHTALDY